MASLDDRYALSGVVASTRTGYRVDVDDLDSNMIPKKPQPITAASVRKSGRGVAYTKSPFAYLFRRIR